MGAAELPTDFFQHLLQALTTLQRSQEVLPTLAHFLPQFEGLLGVTVYQEDTLALVLEAAQPGVSIHQTQGDFTFDYIFDQAPEPGRLALLTALVAAVLRLDQSYRQMETLALQKGQEAYEALQTLRETQTQLVDAEKMGALGTLVAGMAHELNTPLGIGVTALSALQESLGHLRQHFEQGTLSRQIMQQNLVDLQDATQLLQHHLQDAVALIDDFKRVAPRQVHDRLLQLDLKEHLQTVIDVHQHEHHPTPFEVTFEASESFDVLTYPKVWSQILHELLKNTLQHGFVDGAVGTEEPAVHCSLSIFVPPPRSGMSALFNLMDHRLSTQEEGQGVSLSDIPQPQQARFVYRDNGRGIDPQLKTVLFEPFSTRCQSSFSGLGLYMVYNLVHQKLGGNIHLLPSEQGVQFEIIFPLSISESET